MRSILACLVLLFSACGSPSTKDTRPRRPSLSDDTSLVDSSGKSGGGDGIFECSEQEDGNWWVDVDVQGGAPLVYHHDTMGRFIGPDDWVIIDTMGTLRVSCTEGETVYVKWL